MKKSLFFIIAAFIVLCGCGYTTHSGLAPDDPTIHVKNFINKIKVTKEITNRNVYYPYKPGMETDITRDVIDRFIFDGTYRIEDAKNAHFLLKGELVNFKREPLRYDTNDNVIEYRVSAVVNIEFYDLKENKLIWKEQNFAGESTYRTGGQFAKSENAALREAIDDLARRLVERVVENW